MKKVLLRGPCLTQSGYGVHCRQIASWLLKRKDIDVKFQALPWGDTPWILRDKSDTGLIDQIMKNSLDPSGIGQKFDISLQLQLPNEWDPQLAEKNIGVTAGVETDICNPEWIDHCNKMSAVVVPSRHSLECIKKSGKVTTTMHVIPESFCDEILSVETSDQFNFSTNFNFLVFGQITGDNPYNDRKNIFFTLKWLFEAFKDDKDVGIILKTNVGRNTHIDKRRTSDMMRALLKECRRGDFPRLHLLHGDMSNLDVASLYKNEKVKALVTATRGEGYGLPILEAAASDLPVIATGWSGHTDFLNEGKFISLDYELKQIHASRIDQKIFVSGSKWAEVSEEDFKKKLKKFRSSFETPQKWAKELGQKIRKNYCQDAIEKIYDNKLGEFLC